MVHYPGIRLDQLAPALSPFVRLEVGHARVAPHVRVPLSSFIHEHLAAQGMLSEFHENRPRSVRCVHPLVTLFEKLDAMARRYERVPLEAASFVRHYEDVAQILRSLDAVPSIEMSPAELARDMVATKDVRALASPDSPALALADPNKRRIVETAYAEIAPMFWGQRIGLDEACRTIRTWLKPQM